MPVINGGGGDVYISGTGGRGAAGRNTGHIDQHGLLSGEKGAGAADQDHVRVLEFHYNFFRIYL